jgi:multidrug efflux pump subunit AcrA (membrane-fusion protein)
MPQRSRYLRALPLVAAVAFAFGCTAGDERPQPSASARAPVPVAVEVVESRDVREAVEAVGTVRSHKQSALSSRIVAVVRAVHVREGDRAAAGQTLVELDDRDVAAQLRHAEAAVAETLAARDETIHAIAAADSAVEAAVAEQELARATWTRYKRLVDDGLVAAQQYDEVAARYRVASAEAVRARETRASLLARRAQAQAAVARAEADRDNARIAVGYATITAPAAVVVVAKSVEVGNLASPGSVLLTVEEERYRLEATVQESDLRRLALGAKAAVTIDALGRVATTGTVGEIVPAADPLSRTFIVKIDLPGLAGLKSGLYGRARFDVGRRRALTVPRTAITERGQLEAVFVVGDDALAGLRLVKTGRPDGDRVEILAGLSAGERVIVEGVERLADRQPVEVRP